MTARRVAAVGFVVAAVVLLSGPKATANPRERPTGNVTAYDARGHRLAANPVLARGSTTLVVVTGFAPNATVTVRLANTSDTSRTVADSNGTVRYAYTLSPELPAGRHILTFVGDPPNQPLPTPAISALPGGGSRVVATVPTVGLFPFRDPDNHDPDGDDPDGDDAGSGVDAVSVGSGDVQLSYTGADIVGPLLIGVAALAIGTASLALGRRRRLNRR